MYLSHYHLKVKPFQISPDPKFLWLGGSYKHALSIFKNGIAENKGLILLVGDVGTGKTTLINKLLGSLDANTHVASVQYPGFDILDFYNFLADSFNMDKKFSNKGDFLVQFIHFLHEEHARNKKVLLIIDEAQGLSDGILEEIRLLANLERMKDKLLNIFLVGQDEMDNILAEPDNKTLAQSIATKYHLGPLKKGEVKDYINFRLKVAGAEYRIFNRDAIHEIVDNSKCYPRLINVICDHALLTGYVQGKTRIDAAVIKECAREHQLHIVDETKQVLIDNRIEKRADESESTIKTGANYHWALPATLLLALFILSVAGYFAYLRIGSETPKSTIENQTQAIGDQTQAIGDQTQAIGDQTQAIGDQTQEATVPIVDRKAPYKDEIGLDGRNSKKKQSVPIVEEDLGEDKNIEEDLGEDETSDENKNGLAELKGTDEETQPSPKLSQPAENIRDGLSGPYPDGKLIINIPHDSKELPREAYGLIDKFLVTVFQYPDAIILIRGHTDSYGGTRNNQVLSQMRADMVKKYLIAKGIDPTRIKAVGLGEKSPIASNASLTGRNINRRIEIELVRE